MKESLFIVAILCLFGCGADKDFKSNPGPKADSITTQSEVKEDWQFDKINDSRLYFTNGHTLETGLFSLEYIGRILVPGKSPFLIFSGSVCNDCDDKASIFIHSAIDTVMITKRKKAYKYPAIIRDIDNHILSSSSAYYGRVLENTDGVIWYENRVLENGTMKRVVVLCNIVNGELRDTSWQDNGQYPQTIRLKRQGLCKEIEGKEYLNEP